MSEDWHEGYERHGDTIFTGSVDCAGCGRVLSVTCIVIEEGHVRPPAPRYPFPMDDCPVCTLRDRHEVRTVYETGSPTAVSLYKELKACKQELIEARAETTVGEHRE